MGNPIYLNYIGKVDAGDIGRKVFRLSELLSEEDLQLKDPELELSVELVTENTNGKYAARVRLTKHFKLERCVLNRAHAGTCALKLPLGQEAPEPSRRCIYHTTRDQG